MGNTNSKAKKTARLLKRRRPQSQPHVQPPSQPQPQWAPSPVPLQPVSAAHLPPISWVPLVVPGGGAILAGAEGAVTAALSHSPHLSSAGASSVYGESSVTPAPAPVPPPRAPTPVPAPPSPPIIAAAARTIAAISNPFPPSPSPSPVISTWVLTPSTTSSSPAISPDIPFDGPLPSNWRQYIFDVVPPPIYFDASAAVHRQDHYMQIDRFGDTASSEMYRLSDVVMHAVIECDFPLFLTLFQDGTWTTRLRKLTYVLGESVQDEEGTVSKVDGVRIRAGQEEVHLSPLNGRASAAVSSLVGLGVEMTFDAVFGVDVVAANDDILFDDWFRVEDLEPCPLP